MSRVTVVDHNDRLNSPSESVPTFDHSIKSIKEMAAKRRLGLFSAETSLTCVQQNYLFGLLKEHISAITLHAEIQGEFQYQLMMSASDANAFFNILVGWRATAREAIWPLLDRCIRDFQTLYPEVYKKINDQAPIHKPA